MCLPAQFDYIRCRMSRSGEFQFEMSFEVLFVFPNVPAEHPRSQALKSRGSCSSGSRLALSTATGLPAIEIPMAYFRFGDYLDCFDSHRLCRGFLHFRDSEIVTVVVPVSFEELLVIFQDFNGLG